MEFARQTGPFFRNGAAGDLLEQQDVVECQCHGPHRAVDHLAVVVEWRVRKGIERQIAQYPVCDLHREDLSAFGRRGVTPGGENDASAGSVQDDLPPGKRNRGGEIAKRRLPDRHGVQLGGVGECAQAAQQVVGGLQPRDASSRDRRLVGEGIASLPFFHQESLRLREGQSDDEVEQHGLDDLAVDRLTECEDDGDEADRREDGGLQPDPASQKGAGVERRDGEEEHVAAVTPTGDRHRDQRGDDTAHRDQLSDEFAVTYPARGELED